MPSERAARVCVAGIAQSAAKRLREIARIVERNTGGQRGVAIEVQTKRTEPEIGEIDLEESGRITPELDPGQREAGSDLAAAGPGEG
jgi:hypothetical protein